ncbi:MAG: hypothetical protein D6806_18315 [Deltaproteobacteria bacterium]|nr:MAG: hypothetical protein D6806_18315 [Deltaproteobacteria bacterium]
MIENHSSGDLLITVEEKEDRLVLDWRGKSNDRAPGQHLLPFFEKVLQQAGGSGKTVEMHFEHLAHFNSSTITAIIKMLQTARQKKVRTEIVFDGSLKWQKLSFDALRIFEKQGEGITFRSIA